MAFTRTIISGATTLFTRTVLSFREPMSAFFKFVANLLNATSTRATVRTVWGYAPTAVYTDSLVLLSLAIGEVAITNGRRISEGVWSKVDVNGIPFPTTTALSNEDSATNYLLNSSAPVTQTTASLGTGFYTLSVYGTGSALASGGTATITGAASATEGSPNTIQVTVAGTVTVTVTGSLDYFQLEGGSYASSIIITAGTTITRAADINTVPTPSVLTPERGAFKLRINPSETGQNNAYLLAFYTDASDYFVLYLTPTAVYLRKNAVAQNAVKLYTHTAGTLFDVCGYWDSTEGFGVTAHSVGDALPAFTINANTTPVTIPENIFIGSRNGVLLGVGDFEDPIFYASAQDAGWV